MGRHGAHCSSKGGLPPLFNGAPSSVAPRLLHLDGGDRWTSATSAAAGLGGWSLRSSQSSVTTRGQPRARGDARANYNRGWEAEGFPTGADNDGYGIVEACRAGAGCCE